MTSMEGVCRSRRRHSGRPMAATVLCAAVAVACWSSAAGLSFADGNRRLLQKTQCPSEVVNSAAQGTRVTYVQPEINGTKLNYCVSLGSDCGEPAANAFCKSKGLDKAEEFFEWETAINSCNSTLTIGSNESCTTIAKECNGFRVIVCVSGSGIKIDPKIPSTPKNKTGTPSEVPPTKPPPEVPPTKPPPSTPQLPPSEAPKKPVPEVPPRTAPPSTPQVPPTEPPTKPTPSIPPREKPPTNTTTPSAPEKPTPSTPEKPPTNVTVPSPEGPPKNTTAPLPEGPAEKPSTNTTIPLPEGPAEKSSKNTTVPLPEGPAEKSSTNTTAPLPEGSSALPPKSQEDIEDADEDTSSASPVVITASTNTSRLR